MASKVNVKRKSDISHKVITPWIHWALCLYKATYGRFLPYLFDVTLLDGDKFRIVFLPPKKSVSTLVWLLITVPTTSFMMLSCAYVFSGYYDNLTNTIAESQQHVMLKPASAALLVSGWMLLGEAWTYCRNWDMIRYINSKISNELLPDFKFERDTRRFDMEGFLLFYCIIAFNFLGTPLPFVICIVGLNPSAVLLERWFFPTAYEQTPFQILTLFCLIPFDYASVHGHIPQIHIYHFACCNTGRELNCLLFYNSAPKKKLGV